MYHTLVMVKNDHAYLSRLQDYYARHRLLPSYAGMAGLTGLSKRGAVKFADRLIHQGKLEKAPGGKLAPTSSFFERPLVGHAPAGFASPATELLEDALTIDEYLVEHPSSTVLIQVKGDSMVGAGINDKDMLVVERNSNPDIGEIVVAIVDGDFTVKYLQTDRRGFYLQPANEHYSDIRPEGSLEIFGVVVGVFRNCRRK